MLCTQTLYAQVGNSAREILAKQPDFMGEETIMDFEPAIGAGFSITSKIAKKGSTYRRDNGFSIFLSQPNQPTLRLDPKRKTYEELPVAEDDRFLWYSQADDVESFAQKEKITFEVAGTVMVEGHECVKIKATPATQSSKGEEAIYFYAAQDLRDVVIRIEIRLSNRITTYTLKNITFNVPATLFKIPARYKRERA
jgi:hypothetical protein